MNSFERTMAAAGRREPDRVPLFLMLSLYGAKELGLPIREYFANPEYVALSQLRMREKYRNDCLCAFFYAPIEIEAWGGEVVFTEDGPPNSGEPFLRSFEQISRLEIPRISEQPCLQRVLNATRLLKDAAGDETPVIGVVVSPYSVPVMQMGFEKYLELLYAHPGDFWRLMRLNEAFCVEWANAQLAAGADAICYFDPLASPNIIERETYLKTGWEVAMRTIPRIGGAVCVHLASGVAGPVLDDIAKTGAAMLGFSACDDIAGIKAAAAGRICLLGNLNAVEMRNWDDEAAADEVKRVIAGAAAGGGLILSDNHGEIPLQVPEDVLLSVSEAVREYGTYPIRWGRLK